MCVVDPLTNTNEPCAVIDREWQVAHVVSERFGACAGVAGGIPWQVPHVAPPCSVHTGRAVP